MTEAPGTPAGDLAPGLPEARPGSGGNWRRYPPVIRHVIRLHRHQRAVAREVRRPRFHDPVTGDALTLSEEASWLMQGVIRRWAVILLVTAFTAFAWIHGAIWAQGWTSIWNLFASYWAIVLESVVGIAVFSSSRRDSLVLRKVNMLEDRADLHWAALERHLGFPCPAEHREWRPDGPPPRPRGGEGQS